MATPKCWCIILTDVKMEPYKIFRGACQKLYIPVVGEMFLSVPLYRLPIRVQAILERVSNISNFHEVWKVFEKQLTFHDLLELIQLSNQWAPSQNGAPV